MATPNLLLTKLIKELNNAAAKWHEIGLQVGISPGELETIKADKNTSEACLTAVCTRLVQSGDEETVILDKVNSALQSVNRPDLAKRIASINKDEDLNEVGEKSHSIQQQDMADETTPLVQNIPRNKRSKWRKGITMTLLASFILILLIVIILNALSHTHQLSLPRTQDTQEYTSDFTIETGDTVVVPDNTYPKTDKSNISVNIGLRAKSYLGKVNLYKVNRTLAPLSKPISKNATVMLKPLELFYLLDHRYVLKGTTLDITLNFTTEEPCSISTYMFDNHESYADFNRSLRHGDDYSKLLPHRMCMNGNQRQSLVSEVTTSYYSFTIVNIEPKIPTTLAFHINGTQTYYDASHYPVSCSFPQPSNKYCKMNITSQNMILALTSGIKQDDSFAVDLNYEISVSSESVQHLPVYVGIWITVGLLMLISVCICISVCLH